MILQRTLSRVLVVTLILSLGIPPPPVLALKQPSLREARRDTLADLEEALGVRDPIFDEVWSWWWRGWGNVPPDAESRLKEEVADAMARVMEARAQAVLHLLRFVGVGALYEARDKAGILPSLLDERRRRFVDLTIEHVEGALDHILSLDQEQPGSSVPYIEETLGGKDPHFVLRTKRSEGTFSVAPASGWDTSQQAWFLSYTSGMLANFFNQLSDRAFVTGPNQQLLGAFGVRYRERYDWNVREETWQTFSAQERQEQFLIVIAPATADGADPIPAQAPGFRRWVAASEDGHWVHVLSPDHIALTGRELFGAWTQALKAAGLEEGSGDFSAVVARAREQPPVAIQRSGDEAATPGFLGAAQKRLLGRAGRLPANKPVLKAVGEGLRGVAGGSIRVAPLSFRSPFPRPVKGETTEVVQALVVRPVKPTRVRLPLMVIPSFGGSDPFPPVLALYLASQNVASVIVNLPLYPPRAPATWQVRTSIGGLTTWFKEEARESSEEAGRLFAAFVEQSVAELIAAATWAAGQPWGDSSRLGVAGHSLPGTLAHLAYELDPRFTAVVSFSPVDFGTLFWETGRYRPVAELLEQWDGEQARPAFLGSLRHLGLAPAADPRRHRRGLVVAVRGDEVVTAQEIAGLVKAGGFTRLDADPTEILKGLRGAAASPHLSGWLASLHAAFPRAVGLVTGRSLRRSRLIRTGTVGAAAGLGLVFFGGYWVMRRRSQRACVQPSSAGLEELSVLKEDIQKRLWDLWRINKRLRQAEEDNRAWQDASTRFKKQKQQLVDAYIRMWNAGHAPGVYQMNQAHAERDQRTVDMWDDETLRTILERFAAEDGPIPAGMGRMDSRRWRALDVARHALWLPRSDPATARWAGVVTLDVLSAREFADPEAMERALQGEWFTQVIPKEWFDAGLGPVPSAHLIPSQMIDGMMATAGYQRGIDSEVIYPGDSNLGQYGFWPRGSYVIHFRPRRRAAIEAVIHRSASLWVRRLLVHPDAVIPKNVAALVEAKQLMRVDLPRELHDIPAWLVDHYPRGSRVSGDLALIAVAPKWVSEVDQWFRYCELPALLLVGDAVNFVEKLSDAALATFLNATYERGVEQKGGIVVILGVEVHGDELDIYA